MRTFSWDYLVPNSGTMFFYMGTERTVQNEYKILTSLRTILAEVGRLETWNFEDTQRTYNFNFSKTCPYCLRGHRVPKLSRHIGGRLHGTRSWRNIFKRQAPGEFGVRMEVNGLPVLSITGGCHWLLPGELSVKKSINMSPERCKLMETFCKKVRVSVWLQKLGHPYGYLHNIFPVLHLKKTKKILPQSLR
ncbi:hypothetical protein ACFE04_021541 [Oxalis oulophora]